MSTGRRQSGSNRSRPPAKTPEAMENHLISLAVELAEKRIRDGTASAQEIVHFLKLGSSRERLEQERLAGENKLLIAKAEAMGDIKRSEALYQEALNAMRAYSGQAPMVHNED